ncbi:fructoselysine 6-kinase [Ruminococcaceae bacterium OttesenSCG-928-D13]|nr:fructoselysine 6-kinase [Ruminococcaceae bacterium OttesenSCG-928-D13]
MTPEDKKPLRLAAVGDNCMDVYGATGEAFPGGNPVNVAVYTRRLGGAASYTGVVGNDAHGRRMRAAIAAKGVDVSHLHTAPGATAITHVTMENGDRVLGDYEEGVMAHFRLTEDDIDFLAGHDLVVSGLWGMIEKDLPKLKARGVPLAFDFADKLTHPVIDAALPYVDYAFFSRDGGSPEEWRAFLEAMQARGPKVAVVTLGAQGSMAYDGARHYTQGILDCDVVDTMGAGDSYIAGFLYGAMRGRDIPACMLEGTRSSSVTLQYPGAW